jgi:hypothetical protein
MARPDTGSPFLDDELAAFIQGGVSINAASSGPGNVPAVSRALGCRVSEDRLRVTVFLAASRSAALLDAIAASKKVAVAFSQPSTHRTIQLKGVDAARSGVESGDPERLARCALAFGADLETAGYSAAVARMLLGAEPADLVAVSFTPSAAFNQTPGPGAGGPLKRQ